MENSKRRIVRYEAGTRSSKDDHVAIEAPLEIRLRNRSISVTMRTPGQDDELTAGFLLGEGIIKSKSDVESISHCSFDREGNTINVMPPASLKVDFEKLTRHVFASSSCGMCGKASIDSIFQMFPPVAADVTAKAEVLLGLPEKLRKSQPAFDQTGGLHAAAIFDLQGDLLVAREDVGRHNAVDKAIGHCLLREIFPLDKHILLVSGRASFEIMQKSLSARLPIVAAISAPSSLAVDFALESNQTLVGFLRGERMNLYAHEHRVSF